MRLVCGTVDGVALENKPPMDLDDVVRYVIDCVPSVPQDNDTTAEKYVTENAKEIIREIAGRETKLKAVRIRVTKSGFKIEDDAGQDRIRLISRDEWEAGFPFDKAPMDEEAISRPILANQERNRTNYWTFFLHASREIFIAYWFERKTKRKGYGTQRKAGAFANSEGQEIMKKYGSYVRFQIRAFKGMTAAQQKERAERDPNIEKWVQEQDVDPEEAYDLKMHNFIFDFITGQIEKAFHNGLSLLQIGRIYI